LTLLIKPRLAFLTVTFSYSYYLVFTLPPERRKKRRKTIQQQNCKRAALGPEACCNKTISYNQLDRIGLKYETVSAKGDSETISTVEAKGKHTKILAQCAATLTRGNSSGCHTQTNSCSERTVSGSICWEVGTF